MAPEFSISCPPRMFSDQFFSQLFDVVWSKLWKWLGFGRRRHILESFGTMAAGRPSSPVFGMDNLQNITGSISWWHHETLHFLSYELWVMTSWIIYYFKICLKLQTSDRTPSTPLPPGGPTGRFSQCLPSNSIGSRDNLPPILCCRLVRKINKRLILVGSQNMLKNRYPKIFQQC